MSVKPWRRHGAKGCTRLMEEGWGLVDLALCLLLTLIVSTLVFEAFSVVSTAYERSTRELRSLEFRVSAARALGRLAAGIEIPYWWKPPVEAEGESLLVPCWKGDPSKCVVIGVEEGRVLLVSGAGGTACLNAPQPCAIRFATSRAGRVVGLELSSANWSAIFPFASTSLGREEAASSSP